MTFQPAIEMPNIDQAISSQRMTAPTLTSGLSRSAVERPEMLPAVQEARPSHQPNSTPT